MRLATRDLIYEIDSRAEKVQGISPEKLMGNAGLSAAGEILSGLDATASVVVLCGKGKNGGDGYVIAEELWEYRCDVSVFESECDKRDAASDMYRTRFKKKAKSIYSLTDTKRLGKKCADADIIIDALFGVGFHGEMPNVEGEAILIANASKAKKIAVDIPSGCDSDNGTCSDICFRADLTLTMQYVKCGMLTYPAREYCGEVRVCDIGVDRDDIEKNISFNYRTVEDSDLIEHVLSRPRDSHKGTFGRLMLICGSDSMTGAAALACEGALRMGVGLVELVCTEKVSRAVSALCPEVIYTVVPSVDEWNEDVFERIVMHSLEASAVVVGCGLGMSPRAEELIRLLSSIAGCPLLIDADGLNSLDGKVKILANSPREILITPHPKEFARLIYCDIEDVLKDRIYAACRVSEGCGINVLLKGASTVIAARDGTRYINVSGNSGLAKGGSGDVLSGMIGALLAKGTETGLAAALGAYLHGKAAEMLAEEYSEAGVLPRELGEAAAKYLAKLK